jgi:predicted DNA-binding protein (MmcQ/YjbR family)
MDHRSLHDNAHRIALELPFTEHCWPFGPEYDVFKVGGRFLCSPRRFAAARWST